MKYSKGHDTVLHGATVPSEHLAFPPGARLTAAELLTFLPLSLKSHNVIYRFISNGATRHLLWTVVDRTRIFDEQWPANSCGEMMYKAMRDTGFGGWTVKVHNKWHTAENKQKWDVGALTIPNICLNGKNLDSRKAAATIPFKTLANGVRAPPQGYDALDLTRMVQYALEHPEETWLYPDDYSALLEKVGGAAHVTYAHSDGRAFVRLNEKLRAEGHQPQPEWKKRARSSETPQPRQTKRPCLGSDPQTPMEGTPQQPLIRKGRGRPPKMGLSTGLMEDADVFERKEKSDHVASAGPDMIEFGLAPTAHQDDFRELAADVDSGEDFGQIEERGNIVEFPTAEGSLFFRSYPGYREDFHRKYRVTLPSAGESFFNEEDAGVQVESAASIMGMEEWWTGDEKMPQS